MKPSTPRWPRLGLHVWVFWALAAAPLLDLLRRYPEFFIAHAMGARRIGALLAVLLVLLPLPWIVLALLARTRAWSPALLLPPWILFALALATGWGLGMAVLPVALALSALALWAYARSGRVRTYCTWLLLAALAAPLHFLADGSIRKLWLPGSAIMPTVGESTSATPDSPVVVLVLDELPVSSLLDGEGVLDARRFPNLAALAQQAHWFDNVRSVDSSTPKAVAALVAGVQLARGQLPIVRDLPANLFTLLAPSHRILASEPVTGLCPPEFNRLAATGERPGGWLADTAIVALHLVVPEPLAARLPPISDQWGSFGGPEGGNAAAVGTDPTWRDVFDRAGRAVQGKRLARFEVFLASIEDTGRPALYFEHLLLPHRPWIYLPSGRSYRPARYREPKVFQAKRWPASSFYAVQAQQRHLLQAEFVDRLIGRLISRLRETKLYDRALIVVTADHGISFLPGEPKRAVTPVTKNEILQVPLLLKLPGQREGVRHPEPRSTLDVLPTVLSVLGREVPVELLGRSLFTPLSWRTRQAPWRPGLELRAARFGSLDSEEALFIFGAFTDWIGRTLDDLALTSDESLEVGLRGPGWEFESSGGSAFVPALVHGRLRGPGSGRRLGLAFALDGKVVATGEHDPADRSRGFRALLPPSAIGDGTHRLDIVVIDPVTGRGVIPRRR